MMPNGEDQALIAQREWNEGLENPDRGGGLKYHLVLIGVALGALGFMYGLIYLFDRDTEIEDDEKQLAAYDDVPNLDNTDHYNLDFSSELLLGILIVLAFAGAMYAAYKVGTASTYRPSISTGETAVERETLQARLRL